MIVHKNKKTNFVKKTRIVLSMGVHGNHYITQKINSPILKQKST